MIRIFDVLFSLLGLLVLLPLLLLVALAIVIEDARGGPLYIQQRVGRGGREFGLVKFRSMFKNSDRGGTLTVGAKDARITRVGRFLRKWKIDELPQLWNVLVGEMSIVGPRPDVREYVELLNEEQRRILTVRPGITDYASIHYVDESELLGKVEDPRGFYVKELLPRKIELSLRYVDNRNVREYFRVIFLTLRAVLAVPWKR